MPKLRRFCATAQLGRTFQMAAHILLFNHRTKSFDDRILTDEQPNFGCAAGQSGHLNECVVTRTNLLIFASPINIPAQVRSTIEFPEHWRNTAF